MQASFNTEAFREIYGDLRRVAAAKLKLERGNVTLQPTALVNEAYVRLASSRSQLRVESREHFLALASTAMRRVLVDRARERKALKRGENAERVELTEFAAAGDALSLEILELHEALEVLEASDARSARVVELKFFGGCTDEEVGNILGYSPMTARREWFFARAWLANRLGVQEKKV